MAKKNLAALKKIKAESGTKTTEQFALDLLRKTAGFGNAEQLDKAKVIPSNDAVSDYLPNRIFYWPQSVEREYQTLFIELDKSAKEVFKISVFKQKDDLLEVLEDVLARISQLTLNGFAKDRARDASTKWGKQTETLVVLAIKDDHSDEKLTQHVVSFATVNQPKGEDESLDIFYVREYADITDETALAKQKALLKKRHFDLLNSSKWKDAFVTDKERKNASALLNLCKKVKPNTDDIIDGCVDLLQSMASGFLRGQHNQQLKRVKLHSGHQIGLDSNVDGTSPLQGEAIRDQKDRLLGYIVYCVDDHTSEDDIRGFMSANNRFHNVLIIYPDVDEPGIELWQGKKCLKGKLRKDKTSFTGVSKLVSVLTRFFAISSSDIKSPEQLATELAYRARFLKQVAFEQLEHEAGSKKTGNMQKLFNDFKTSLIHTITESEFTDAYAQTLTYGLLSARWVMAEEIVDKVAAGDDTAGDVHFTRRDAIKYLPTSSGFLKQFFNEVLQNTEDDGKVAWILSDIADVLDKTHIQYVFGEGDVGASDADPIIHFYEPFLNAYDAEERQRRGVYYTPQPVVDFIVKNVDQELKDSFGLVDGLADDSSWKQVIKANSEIVLPVGVDGKEPFIKLLDPATGTGTFLVAVIDQVHITLKSKWLEEGKSETDIVKLWTKYVDGHLVNMLYGFEVMMASYAIAHLKISLKLRQTGYRSHHKTPFNIFLTNTLEGVVEQGKLEKTAIAEEAERAREVKLQVGFTVIIGNPPYSGHSANQSVHLDQLLEEYKREPDGGPLKERNSKWINDDYVKFIRFGQVEINKSGAGVHSFITNHSWIDNPTFRGVRASILKDFSDIKLIDLHGNIKKGEVCPDGSSDENVFDIQQGTAVFLFSTHQIIKDDTWKSRTVHCEDYYGLRQKKYSLLEGGKFNVSEAEVFSPRLNLLIFRNSDDEISSEYEKGWKINEIFPLNSVGVVTSRDKFTIDVDKDSLEKKFQDFRSNKSDDEVRLKYFGENKKDKKYPAGDNASWKMSSARYEFSVLKKWKDCIQPIEYRPFDKRWIMYSSSVVERLRWEVMEQMFGGVNLGVMTCRQVKSDIWQHVMPLESITESCFVSNKTSEIGYHFPLYKLSGAGDLLDNAEEWEESDNGYTLNLNKGFVLDLEKKINAKFVPYSGDRKNFNEKDILYYILAVMFSTGYRERYQRQLKPDFPVIPITSNFQIFKSLACFGEVLFSSILHFDNLVVMNCLIVPVASCSELRKFGFVEDAQSLVLNDTDTIKGVSKEVWEYEIGAYKILPKWLKNRKGREITTEFLEDFCRVITSVSLVIKAVNDIDSKIGTWPIK